MSIQTKQEGVILLQDDDKELIGIVYKDPTCRKNIFFKCKEMNLEDIEELFKKTAPKQ